MTIDLHYHTILTKRLAFDTAYLERSADAARRAGLDAIAMTDHFDSRDFAAMPGIMRARYRREGDAHRVGELLIFPGAEVDVAEGPHVLLIATSEACDEIAARTAAHRTKGRFMEAAALLDLADRVEAIRICAHPTRPGRELTRIDRSLWHRFDAIGLNGRDLFREGREVEARVRALAAEAALPVVGGSDTHQYLQAGAVSNELDVRVTTVADLRTAIRDGRLLPRIDPCLAVRVEAAQTIKALIKGRLDD